MGWTDRIGRVLPADTPGEMVKARTSRLVEAERYITDNGPRLATAERDAIATWVETGGRRPWDPEPAAVAIYPPVAPR